MQNKIRFTLLAFFFISSGMLMGLGNLSKEEIIEMIPKGLEKDSPNEIQNWQTLIDSGESIYLPLSEILLDPKHEAIANDVISLFVKSKGDKTLPLQALRKYLEVNAKKVPLDRTIFSVVIAMGTMGGKSEAEALRDLVDPDVFQDPDRTLLRHSVEANLEKIEKRLKNQELDAAAHERIESIRGTNSENGNKTIATLNTGLGLSSALKSRWPWVAGGSLLLLIAVICLKRRFGANTES